MVLFQKAGRQTNHLSPSPGSDTETALATVDPQMRSIFIQFLTCQLYMEAQHCLKVNLIDMFETDTFWNAYKKFANLTTPGRCEKWVPFHMCLGVHDRFIIEGIYDAKDIEWSERQRFLIMFIFRAHCCVEMFQNVQRELLQTMEFWAEPYRALAPDGLMETSILDYRHRTGKPLQTGAFRIIPKRLCEDDNLNLVRNICLRTRKLLQAAEGIYTKVEEAKALIRDADIVRITAISNELYQDMAKNLGHISGVGDTWIKMLMLSTSVKYPEFKLLQASCEVGTGAIAPLRKLVRRNEGSFASQLATLTADLNHGQTRASNQHFWNVLRRVEQVAQNNFDSQSLFHPQLREAEEGLAASTVQVQLCEFRQFLEFCDRQDDFRNPVSASSSTQPEAYVTEEPASCHEPQTKRRRQSMPTTEDATTVLENFATNLADPLFTQTLSRRLLNQPDTTEQPMPTSEDVTNVLENLATRLADPTFRHALSRRLLKQPDTTDCAKTDLVDELMARH